LQHGYHPINGREAQNSNPVRIWLRIICLWPKCRNVRVFHLPNGKFVASVEESIQALFIEELGKVRRITWRIGFQWSRRCNKRVHD
jgi:hypothetical protein